MKTSVPISSRLWGAAALLLLLNSVIVQAQDRLAIKGATIIPVIGERIEGGTIVISDGRIEAVGKDVKIPVEARVIDATDHFVMPGIINVHSAAGMSQANERNPNVPFLSVIDSIDPISRFFDESRRNGVTTAAVVPGNSTMIGGRSAIVKTAGTYVDDMIVKRDAGLKISLTPTSGSSRMSHIAKLRKELQKAKERIQEEKETTKKETDDSKEEDAGKGDKSEQDKTGDDASKSKEQKSAEATEDALKQLLEGKFPAIIYCQTSMDVPQALRLIDEFKLEVILVLGRECDKAATMLAKRKIPVVLDSTMVFWRTHSVTREDEKIVLPKIFKDADVSFVFQAADSGTNLGTHYHWYQAATAVRYGMSVDDALKALTIDSAKLLGIDSAVGSIEKGKDADLVILTGEPLSGSTWVKTTIVQGKVVYEKSEDRQLELLFHPEKDAN